MNSDLPRLNIVVNADSFAYMYKYFLQPIELSATIEYWENNANKVFTEAAVIDIRGSGSAHNKMKSIGVRFNKKIDNATFQIVNTQQALPGHNLDALQDVRLRNSGNDDPFTQFKDLALTEFLIDYEMDMELKYGTPFQVFVNNRYYGLLNFRTENTVIALSDLLQVNQADITMMKIDLDNGNLEHREGDEVICDDLRLAIKNEDIRTLESLIDVENFMDYIIFEDYVSNADWPHNNVRIYSIAGSKFRFLLYDLDLSLKFTKQQILPRMEYLKDDLSKMYQIFREKEEGFIESFETRQKMWYQKFSPNHFNSVVDGFVNVYRSEIKYKISKYNYPSSTLEWNLSVDDMRRSFEQNDKNNRSKYNLN